MGAAVAPGSLQDMGRADCVDLDAVDRPLEGTLNRRKRCKVHNGIHAVHRLIELVVIQQGPDPQVQSQSGEVLLAAGTQVIKNGNLIHPVLKKVPTEV